MIILRWCRHYLIIADKVNNWWNVSAVPQVVAMNTKSGGWLGFAKNTLFAWVTPSTPDQSVLPKED